MARGGWRLCCTQKDYVEDEKVTRWPFFRLLMGHVPYHCLEDHGLRMYFTTFLNALLCFLDVQLHHIRITKHGGIFLTYGVDARRNKVVHLFGSPANESGGV